MLLAIDSGNTNIVFAIFDDQGTVLGKWRSSTDTNRTADEFGIWLDQLMGLHDLDRKDVTQAIIGSVVPDVIFTLRTLCRRYFDCEALVIGDPAVKPGINILLDQPREVGADRVVNAVGAHDRHGGPMIVIDFGTATTFDVVAANGDYCGGAIAPGINLSLEALHMAAAKLPRVAIERPEKVIGKGTVRAIQSGVFWGYIGMIEGLTRRIQEEYGEDMRVIATGGLAPLFAAATTIIEKSEPDLTLHGLWVIYQRNQETS